MALYWQAGKGIYRFAVRLSVRIKKDESPDEVGAEGRLELEPFCGREPAGEIPTLSEVEGENLSKQLVLVLSGARGGT